MKKLTILGIIGVGIFLTGCSSNSNVLPNQENKNNGTLTSEETTSYGSNKEATVNSGSVNNNDTNAASAKIKVSLDDAIKAYEQAYPNTAITSIDLSTTLGAYYYEITGVDDAKEYEVKINAETGELTKEREEALDADERNGVAKKNEAVDLKNILTIEKATDIAIEAAGQGEAVEWTLEREMSTTYWEIAVKNGSSETSVKMDAKTGNILETELED